ncbi:hypothetical protein [Methylobacterium brachiatum]|uniref:hypothetical protein n=1 Tax=Methylobacterium brachiatum TaxID=269660 RepID=UPI000EFC9BED|nr:hypothetical protein [Methylobacterium brachiatum]AYO81605.1 hypothetical protein EBB05_04500 [Methylobacterium brachiatum]
MDGEIITQDGEVLEPGALAALDSGTIAAMSKAEITAQVETARRYPRSVTRASKNINSLATLDDQAAQECIYALPRGGRPIRGPSIRLAEIVAQQWGNNRVATRVIEVDRREKVIVAEAVFHDLETNAAVKATVRHRISDRQGRLLNDDMIVVTGNAASSIARRNAILAGVPKGIWRRAYEAAEGVVKGDVKTLAERRAGSIKAFGTWGVKPEQIFAALGVVGEDEITLEHIPTLIGMFQAIKNGEETVESLFINRAAQAGKAFDKVSDPLNDGDTQAGPQVAAGKTEAANPDSGETGDTAGEGAEAEPDRSNPVPEAASGAADGAAQDKTTIDPSHPDYDRGFRDGEAGTKKCLSEEIKADPARYATWRAGHRDGTAARVREEADA